jgi:PAS domain S-box-containing protein
MSTKLTEKLEARLEELNSMPPEETGREKVEVLNDLAYAFHRFNPAKTEEYARQALALAAGLDDEKNVARAYLLIGVSYLIRGEDELGLEQSLISLAIYERTGDKEGIAKCCNNIGLLHSSRSDTDQALSYLNRALSLNEELDLKINVANNHNTIGITYYMMEDYDKALEHLLKSLEPYEKDEFNEKTIPTYTNISAIHIEKNEYDLAEEYLQKALKISKRVNDKKSLCISLHNMGDLALRRKQYDSALDHLEQSLALAQEIELRRMHILNYECLSRLYEALGDYKKSFCYYKKYSQVKGEVFSEDTSKKIARLELRHEIDKKEQEAEIFRLKNVELEAMVEERTERLVHLNAVLSAVRNVNQLITHETDRDTLLRQACDKLIETRGYYSAWIVLLDENKKVLDNFQAGIANKKPPAGATPTCFVLTMDISGVVTIDAGDERCQNCLSALVEHNGGQVARLVTRLSYEGRVFGTICVTLPAEMAHNSEEEDLFREVTGDISFALYHIEVKEKRRESERLYRSLYDSMSEGMTVNELIFERGKAVDYRVIDVNPAFEIIAGEQWSKLVDKRATEFFGSQTVPFIEIMEDVVNLQKSTAFEMYYPRLKGHFHTSIFPLGEKDHCSPAIISKAGFTDVTKHKRAEDAMRASEERYRSLQANIPVGIFRTTPEGKFLSANAVLAHMLGYETVDELTSIPVTDAYAFPEGRQKFINRIKEEGVVADFETQLRRKDGTVIWASLKSRAVTNENGDVVHYDGIVENIDDRKLAEEAREHIHRLLLEERNMFVSGKVLLFKWKNEEGWPVEYVSDNVEDIFGYSVNDWMSGTISYADIIPEEDIERVGNEVKHYSESGASKFKHEPYRVICKDGKTIWLDDYTTILRDEAGNVTHYLGYVVDITEGKEAGEAMRESEERYRSIWNNSPVGIALTDRSTKITMVNSAFCRILGYQSDELNDRPLFELLAEEDDKLFASGLNTEIHEELSNLYSGHPTELTFLKKNGEPIIVDLSIDFITSENGSLSYMIVQMSDITNRRQTEEALRESEEFNRAINENSPIGISVRNPLGKLISANEAWKKIWAVPEDEVEDDLSRQRDELQLDERDSYLGRWADEVKQIYTEGGSLYVPELEVSNPRPGGALWVSQHFYSLANEAGKVERIVILTEDITEQKLTEGALKGSEDKFRDLIKAAPDGIEMLDAKGKITSCNDAHLQLLGYTRDEMKGKHTTDFFTQESLATFKEKFPLLRKTGSADAEITLVRKDGTLVSVWRKAQAIYDDGGDLIGAVSFNRNITEKKITEDALSESERTYRLLYDTVLAVARKTELADVVAIISDQATRLLNSTFSIFFRYDSEKDYLYPLYTNAPGQVEAIMQLRLPLGSGLSGRVGKSRLGAISNYNDPENVSMPIKGTNHSVDSIQSVIAEPVLDGEDLLGVLLVGVNNETYEEQDQGYMRVFARMASLVLSRALDATALSESEQIYHALYDTTLVLAEENDTQSVIEVIAEQATSLLKANACMVLLVDYEKKVLQPYYTTREEYRELFSTLEIPFGSGLSGLVAQTGVGRYLNVDDVESISIHIEGTDRDEDENESIISVPMFDGKRVMGVLTVTKFYQSYNDDDLSRLTILARQAEIALKRSRDRKFLATSEATYRALYETTLAITEESNLNTVIEHIVSTAKELLDSFWAVYSRFDPETRILTPLYTNAPDAREEIMSWQIRLGEGLTGLVAEQRKGMYSNYNDKERPVAHIEGTDDITSVESVIAEPVLDGDTLLGVLFVSKRSSLYTDNDLFKLRVFARLASISIKRADSLEALAVSEATYRALYETTTALAEVRDLNEVTKIMVEQSAELLNAGHCTFYRLTPDGTLLEPIQSTAERTLEQIMAYSVKLGEGLTGLTAQTGVGITSNAGEDKSGLVKIIPGTESAFDDVESLICEPILSGERVIGVLTLSKLREPFTKRDQEVLRIFASLASVALNQAENRRELEDSETKHRTLVETATDGIAIIQNGVFKFVNSAMESFSGYSTEEIQGRSFLSMVALDEQERLKEMYQRRMDGEDVADTYETVGITRDGLRIPVEVKVALFNYEGSPAELVMIRDITERRQAEEETHKLSLAIKNSPSVVAITGTDGLLEYVNPRFTEVTGYTSAEVIGQNPSILNAGLQPKEFYRELWEAIKTRGEWRGEFANRRKNGEIYWEEARIAAITNEKGEITNYVKLAEDITERRQAAEQIRQLNEVLRAIRNVNQLITREKELQPLVDGACEMLTESRYGSAWIYLENEKGQFESWAEAGLSGKLVSLHQHLLQNNRPASLETLFSGEVDSFVGKIFESEDDEPLTDSPDVVIALKTEDNLHGLLGVTTGYGEQPDEEELQLIGELADDLVQAIYTIKLEKAHRAGEIRYRYFADHVSDGIWAFEPPEPLELSLSTEELVNASFKAFCSDCNNAYAAMFGMKKEDIIGKRLDELMPPEDEENRAYLTAFFNNDYRIDNVESREVDAEGNEHYFLNSMFAKIKDGRLIRAWGRQQDITEKRGTEVELKKRDVILEAVGRLGELLLRNVSWETNADVLLKELCLAADASRVYIFENTWRDDGTRQTSQRFEWVVDGVSVEIGNPELQGLSYPEVGFERWEKVLQQGDLIHGSVRDFPQSERDILTPQGIKSILIVPIFVGGEWWGFIGFDNCVSEEEWLVSQVEALRVAAGILGASIGRQRMVEELRYSEERYRLVVSNSPLGIAVCDTTGKIELVNESLVEMLGSPSSEATMKINVFTFPLLQKAGISKTFRTTLETGLNFTSDHFYKSKWGKEVFVRFFLTPLRDSNQRVIGVQALVQDITEIKKAEESLMESEERLQAIFEYAPVAYFLHDLKGKLIDGNRAAEEMTGYLRNELISKSFKKLKLLSAGDIVRAVKNMMKNALGKATGPVEYTFNRKDGTKVPVAISAYPIKIKGKTIVLGVAMDLTERKKGEEALANYSADLEREVKLKTEELNLAERFLRSVIDGSRELITVVDADGNLEIVNQAASRAIGYSEEEVQGKPVSIFYFESDFAQMLDLQRRLAVGEENIVFPVSLRCKDGSPLPVEISISPLFDTNGNFSGSVAVARDTREVAQLRKALLQSEKLASTGQLAANIAHEVNNPLTIIKNYLHLASEELDENSQNSGILSIIGEEVERIARIINGLLSFYRPENTWMAPTNVNELIEKLLGFMRITLAKSNITIEDELQPDLPLIILTPDQLYQVLLNMVKNAQEAMPNGGTLRIATWQEKNSLHISISDTGRGIEKNDLDNIFDPFFTTKGSTGTGLGLSISYGIIKSLDGEIKVTSKPGKGTTFTIILLIA